MKLFRYRTAEGIRPGLMDASGTARDLSDHLDDVTPTSLVGDALAGLSALDISSLPVIEGGSTMRPASDKWGSSSASDSTIPIMRQRWEQSLRHIRSFS